MNRYPTRSSETRRKRIPGQLAWGAAISFLGIGISIGLFTWFWEQALSANLELRVDSFFTNLSLILLHALLAVSLERTCASLSIRRKWQYRAAFLVSMGLGWAVWGYLGIENGNFRDLLLPVLAFCGAFLGGLFATAVNETLWENNSPPSNKIQAEVYQLHLEVIGNPRPVPWQKRCFDLGLATVGLIVSTPVWTLITFLIWFEDPGPILFVKNSVGKGGHNFHQFKFRTMVRGAEINTGPILSREGDDRVLLIGKLLRKTALDELPQLINILKGEMSFVGPRPQRTILVHDYLVAMPEYAERHRILPGLAGLAQVAGDYYLTPRQKLRFDRLYIQNLGLGNDIKLLFLACLVTFWLRWRKDWNGRMPRKFLKLGRRRN